MKKNLIKKKTFNRLQKSTLHFENQLNNIYHGWFLYWDASKGSYFEFTVPAQYDVAAESSLFLFFFSPSQIQIPWFTW